MKIIYSLLVLLVLLIDQSSKSYFRPILQNGNIIQINQNVRLINTWNTGISFGMLHSLKNAAIILSIISAIVILVLIYSIYKNQKHKSYSLPASIIVGGALGNAIDRVQYGAVYDFIDFYILDWHWPTFNIADSCIVLGAIMLIFDIFIRSNVSSEMQNK